MTKKKVLPAPREKAETSRVEPSPEVPASPEADQFGLSPKHWADMKPEHQELYRQVRPLRRHAYSCTVQLHRLKAFLDDIGNDIVAEKGVFDLNPDFQRGHVWTMAQRIAYVESVLRGTAPTLFRFNSASYEHVRAAGPGEMNPYDFVCIDGLQRLTALMLFASGHFRVFCSDACQGYTAKELEHTPFWLARYHCTFEVYAFRTREHLLQFYLDLNGGGTVHTQEELDRVKGLLAKERA